MRRDCIKQLHEWKTALYRKPLVVKGARQVGKTWLIREFGKSFPSFVEINFEREPEYAEIFKRGLDPKRIIMELGAALGDEILPGQTLLFFDEIQQAPSAVKSLRYFYEELPELHIVAAGSLIGFVIDKIPTGVGRLSYLNLYPMTFAEFLTATGNDPARKRILSSAGERPLPVILHKKLLDLCRVYFLIGGMPAVVAAYVEKGDFKICQSIQTDILKSFTDDFVKYSKDAQIPHLNRIFSSVPLQLGNKFVYSRADRETRSHYLSAALELLETAGLLHRIYHTKTEGLPLNAGINSSRFKAILFDTGLLQRMTNVDLKLWMTDVDLCAVNNGAIAEQFAGQELAAYTGAGKFAEMCHWRREKRGSTAEIDYLIELSGRIVPVEVKANVQGGMKSMHMFMNEKRIDFGIKISKYPFSFDGKIKTVPFYGIEELFHALQTLENA